MSVLDNINFQPGTEEFKIFMYENYVKLYNNLNRIKQLQLFTIDSYHVDYIGNQWFLYKPKYESFMETNNECNIYEFPGQLNDINLKEIKSSTPIKEFENVPGELWVRLNNFPFAYPIEMNVKCTLKMNLWRSVLTGKIYKFNIFENFGYIYYNNNVTNEIHFFMIEDQFQKDSYFIKKAEANFIEKAIIDTYEAEESISMINKRVFVNPLKTLKFKTNETLIDIIPYGGKYFVFYHDENLVTTNAVKVSVVDTTSTGIKENIKQNITVNLPRYDINGNNVCSPNHNTKWVISMSADNINIAYEAIPTNRG